MSKTDGREHSKNYAKYMKYYQIGAWSKKMLHDVAEKGKLLEWEYEEITGCAFDEE